MPTNAAFQSFGPISDSDLSDMLDYMMLVPGSSQALPASRKLSQEEPAQIASEPQVSDDDPWKLLTGAACLLQALPRRATTDHTRASGQRSSTTGPFCSTRKRNILCGMSAALPRHLDMGLCDKPAQILPGHWPSSLEDKQAHSNQQAKPFALDASQYLFFADTHIVCFLHAPMDLS